MIASLFGAAPPIDEEFTEDSRIVLYPGDTNDLLAALPDNSIRLIITSPPYNLGKDYENRVSIQQYLAAQTKIIAELSRILTSDGSICWQVGNFVDRGEVFPLDILYYPIFKDLGLYMRNRIVWHFDHGLHASRRFSGRYETLLWFTKTEKYVFNLDSVRVPSKYPGKLHYKGEKRGQPSGNPLGKNPSDVWAIIAQEWEDGYWDIPNVKSNHPEKTSHPCQYPIELVERCVLALTHEDDWVFDPYSGVGSALIAAIKHGRRALGSEKDAAYIAIARERIRSYFNGTLKIRPLGKPVHVPSGREKVTQVPLSWKAGQHGDNVPPEEP